MWAPGACLVTLGLAVWCSRFDVAPAVLWTVYHVVALCEAPVAPVCPMLTTELSLSDEVPSDAIVSSKSPGMLCVTGSVTKYGACKVMGSLRLAGAVLNKSSVKSVSESEKFDGSAESGYELVLVCSDLSLAGKSRITGCAVEEKSHVSGTCITGDSWCVFEV